MSKKKNKEFRDSIYNRLWTLSGTLRGVGALLEQQSSSACYDHDELFGLGQFLKSLGEETSKIEDSLRAGYDIASEEG